MIVQYNYRRTYLEIFLFILNITYWLWPKSCHFLEFIFTKFPHKNYRDVKLPTRVVGHYYSAINFQLNYRSGNIRTSGVVYFPFYPINSSSRYSNTRRLISNFSPSHMWYGFQIQYFIFFTGFREPLNKIKMSKI